MSNDVIPTAAAETRGRPPYVIMLPVFNDWPALRKLLADLDGVLAGHGLTARVLIVDDASSTPAAADFPGGPYLALHSLEIVELRRNLGHQRAIAIGLAYVEAHVPCEAVVVMDSDGEDAPRDVPRLLAAYRAAGEKAIVFAERTKRSERLTFRVFYQLYQLLYRALTGQWARFGNFSVVPATRLKSLVVVSELWNHYTAAVVKSRQPMVTVPTARATRLAGASSMNFVNLVIHGMSALSVQSDAIGVRLLAGTTGLILFALGGLAAVIGVRLFTDLAIPGWATYTAGVFCVVLLQAVMFFVVFSFLTLAGRQGATFLPLRDYAYFIGRITPLSPK